MFLLIEFVLRLVPFESHNSRVYCSRRTGIGKVLSMPQPGTQGGIYRFGSFELAATTGELRKNGLRLKLQDQPTRILILLLENAGEVVTREQIQKRLWADEVYVDYENAINSAVRKLREVLIDNSDNPRFVETLPRRGYRFVARFRGCKPALPSRKSRRLQGVKPRGFCPPACW